MHDVLQIALLKIFRCAVGVHFLSNCVQFTRLRCAENPTQDHYRPNSTCDGVLSQLHASKDKT